MLTARNLTPVALIVAALAASAMMFAAPDARADVYKTVDENGNVIFTDQPPPDGAEPMDLPEIGVIETSPAKPLPGRSPEEQAAREAEGPSLRELQRQFNDFAIVSPQPEQTFWGTGSTATVSWDTGRALLPGMAVAVSVDGQERPATRQQSFVISNLERGEHTLTAELRDRDGRRVATAEPVTFFMKQHSENFNRPVAAPVRPRPRGGGSGG